MLEVTGAKKVSGHNPWGSSKLPQALSILAPSEWIAANPNVNDFVRHVAGLTELALGFAMKLKEDCLVPTGIVAYTSKQMFLPTHGKLVFK